MPKWKTWLSDQSWDEWTDFLDSGVRKLEEAPSITPEWPIQILRQHSQVENSSQQPSGDLYQSSILLTRERQECLVSTGNVPY